MQTEILSPAGGQRIILPPHRSAGRRLAMPLRVNQLVGFGAGGSPTIGPPAGGSDPLFEFVELVADCDGADESTTYTEQSAAARSFIFEGAAKLDDAQKEYGTTSIYGENSTNTGVRIVGGNAFDLPGDFCMEASVYATGTGNLPALISRGASGQSGRYAWWLPGGEMQFYIGGTMVFRDAAFGTPLNQWAKLCISREGNTWRSFKNGTLSFESTNGTAIPTATHDLWLARDSLNATGRSLAGWSDNYRFTIGAARRTASYVPETGPFPTSA